MKIYCFQTHLPGYIADADKLKAQGVNEIVCISVNDAFVMDAWGQAQKAEGKVSGNSSLQLFIKYHFAIPLFNIYFLF